MFSNVSPPTTTLDNTSQPEAQQLISSLPNDISLQILARTPRIHHPTLALVSKSWRSIFRSSLLYTTRSLLKCTNPIVYLNIRVNNKQKWYYYHSDQDSQVFALSETPRIPSRSIGSAFAVVGPEFYVIGGSVNDVSSPNVWVFDCRFNEWKSGPKMRVSREFAAAEAVDGKIYVMGGCSVDSLSKSVNWAEVFDPLIGSWKSVASPVEVRDKWMHASAVIKGKVYAMADRGGVVFNPEDKEWGSVDTALDLGWRGRATTVNDVLYCYDYLGKIRGFDVDDGLWKELKGVDKGLPRFLCGATMTNVDGKLVLIWEGPRNGNEMEIFCAKIEVWKDKDGELCGSIVSSDVILVVPCGSYIVHCLAVVL